MRLTNQEISSIKQSFTACFDTDDHLWLFGSRADPQRRGGDIDLYIETHSTNKELYAHKKISFMMNIQEKIEEQKIDVVINFLPENKEAKIFQEAKKKGILII